ncbi:tRNA lysidine(34) synthetase TilS [uncultured Pseudoteredinibacter sp.]|uniref:tRNA lysidine(34) synthetase TilS n=1 Tax=uncultured Pseudoteredinibacter sp. TaxID=1641701 RepID=UPI0026371616|nr:tRNA lysidine(34) synthetase TilS [uncultured Pseudoteredinibacter sp.]
MSTKDSINILSQYCFDTLQALLSETQWQQCANLCIAYSGGLDSSVLLRTVVELRDKGLLGDCILKAIHVNHGLSDLANSWQGHCKAQCQQLGVEFYSQKVSLDDATIKSAGGLEAAARTARYQVFEQFMVGGDILLQGHHQDDQAETLLLRLMRGAGPKGLASIPSIRSLSVGLLARPLLDVPRRLLEQCAEELNLTWVEDPSNQDSRIDRNFLRNQVLPLLQERWPGFQERWAASSRLCAESEAQLQHYQEKQLAVCDWRAERLGFSLCLQRVADLSRSEQFQLIRACIERLGLAMPSRAFLEELDEQLLRPKRDDSEALLHSGACSFACHQGRLYYWPQGEMPTVLPASWATSIPLDLGEGWQLLAEEVALDEPGLWLPESVELHHRDSFKRAKPEGRRHSQTIKKLLQEAKLEAWLRPHVPFIAWQGQLLAVADLWVEQEARAYCQAVAGARYCRVVWRHLG